MTNTIYYIILQDENGQREIYRKEPFGSLKEARKKARQFCNAIEIGRYNSQGYLFYNL